MSLLLEPSHKQIKEEKLYQQMGLSDEEFALIESIIGRLPNYTETGIFSVMWSEHCSYKNSKPVLSNSRQKESMFFKVLGKALESLILETTKRLYLKSNHITIHLQLNRIKERQQVLAESSVMYSPWVLVQLRY